MPEDLQPRLSSMAHEAATRLKTCESTDNRLFELC